MTSAISPSTANGVKPRMGMNSWMTTSAAKPTIGAARKVVLEAAVGIIVSLPQSLKKS